MAQHLLTRVASTIALLLIAAPSTADLVAHWPLNEGSGEVVGKLASGNDGFLPEEDLAEVEWSADVPPGNQDVSVGFIGGKITSDIATPYEGILADAARTVTHCMRVGPYSKHTAVPTS